MQIHVAESELRCEVRTRSLFFCLFFRDSRKRRTFCAIKLHFLLNSTSCMMSASGSVGFTEAKKKLANKKKQTIVFRYTNKVSVVECKLQVLEKFFDWEFIELTRLIAFASA